MPEFPNPFRPGAGHMPPHLAGRTPEIHEFRRLLEQSVILENAILTGLRGVGKTVLLETLKPIAIQAGWLWVGTDLSESTSVSDDNLAVRLLSDLSVVTSSIVIATQEQQILGFISGPGEAIEQRLDYKALTAIYRNTPGLTADKLKAVLEIAWRYLLVEGRKGVIFAYDEAQNLSEYAEKEQYPLSLLLDVFQSIQKKNIPFMLVLAGLPTLFPKLVDARTFSERMFHIITLDKLSPDESREAILVPLRTDSPVQFTEDGVTTIVETSGGYPYFIQFICREIFDVLVQNISWTTDLTTQIAPIIRKLDTDFFAGRWARATDRQRELLQVAAALEHAGDEFAVQDLVRGSKQLLQKPFSSSHVNQMLATLCEAGLICKNRFGKYSFAVPLFDRFIRRQISHAESLDE